MVTLTDIQLEVVRKFTELRKDYVRNARRIKKVAMDIFGDSLLAVYVFGSVVRGEEHPMSDVDVAVVLSKEAGEEERMALYRKIRKMFGLHPFEIHVVTAEEWERWYRKFVKDFVKI